jgi:rhamnose utilization protein RhaD (predicted bifunctional aldolase and dehydrogenase)
MNAELAALRALSAEAGADVRLTQAAGGNTSVKLDEVMWIKASGTWLRDAAEKDIFVPVALDALRKGLAEGDPACENCLAYTIEKLNPHGLRPSIETTVHAIMPHPVVVHVHCVETISWAVRKDAEALLAKRLRDFNWRLVPYVRPGLPLAHAIRSVNGPGVEVLVFANHGLAVAANTVENARTLLYAVVAALRVTPRPVPQAATDDGESDPGYRVPVDPLAHGLARDPVSLAYARRGSYYPDHVIFLGSGITLAPTGARPPMLVLPGKGILIARNAKSAVEPMARCLSDVLARIEPGAALNTLSADDEFKLLNWEAETYRQTLASPL